MLKKILYSTHRILGTILRILFLVWFLSGFVMMYHTFPKVSEKDKYAHSDILDISSMCIDSLLTVTDANSMTSLKLLSYDNQAYVELITADSCYRLGLNPVQSSILKPTFAQIERYASRWVDADILRVDTLRELDQWIPFSRLRDEFPIYKFHFDDKEKHQLYISSKTGKAIQFTNKENRFWAWIGAIPHWIYFTRLRQNAELWSNLIILLAGIGCIMCISGIILGVCSYIKQMKKRIQWKTVYKKQLYKLHHIFGFIFGLFVFTFAFSGMMSLAKVPQWMVKVHRADIQRCIHNTVPIIPENYKLDYRNLLNEYNGLVKSIEWSSFGDIPLYKVVIKDSMYTFDASVQEIKLLRISEEMIRNRLSKIHNETITINQISEYDNYYIDRKARLPLPVYRVDVKDADNSTYYVSPDDGHIIYYNSNTKARRYAYQMLHCFNVDCLIKYPILWNIVMWSTMIGGTVISFTGFLLGFKYIKRRFKSWQKRRKIK